MRRSSRAALSSQLSVLLLCSLFVALQLCSLVFSGFLPSLSVRPTTVRLRRRFAGQRFQQRILAPASARVTSTCSASTGRCREPEHCGPLGGQGSCAQTQVH